jgi:ribosomal protein L7Ae-like RNA K-turn-binding protein
MGHGARSMSRVPPGVVVGAKAVLRAAAGSSLTPVNVVIVATDAPEETIAPVRRLATERALALVEVPSSVELGLRCGIARPVAAAAELRTA